MKSKTIVLIHGMFMTPLCWGKWIPYYEAKGYRVFAPAWPGRDKPIDELRKAHPDPELAKLKLNHIVDHMEAFVESLDENQRGKSYGKQAMLLIEEKARELGLKSIGLHVFGSNKIARNLYEGVGY